MPPKYRKDEVAAGNPSQGTGTRAGIVPTLALKGFLLHDPRPGQTIWPRAFPSPDITANFSGFTLSPTHFIAADRDSVSVSPVKCAVVSSTTETTSPPPNAGAAAAKGTA